MTVERYIELKLKGCLDSKELLAKEYGISKNEIVKTLRDKVCEMENISVTEYEKFQEQEGRNIQKIKALYTGKERTEGFQTLENFYNWYMEQNQKCCYCGVNSEDLGKYFNENNEQYKEARQRGQVLEIERIVTVGDKNVYNEHNCSLACYICNNAKSDFISPISFKPIAYGINQFWIEQGVNAEFPKNSAIWSQS